MRSTTCSGYFVTKNYYRKKIEDMRTVGFNGQFYAQNSHMAEDDYRFPDNDLLSLWEGNYSQILVNAKILKEKAEYFLNVYV